MHENGPWRSRIVGYGEESPDQLLANEKNWRIHPSEQQKALSAVLNKVGIVQNVIVNQRSGKMVDGHLRVMLAISEGQPKVPITYVDLSDEEEAAILATLDPLAEMAAKDEEIFKELVDGMDDSFQALVAGTEAGQPGGASDSDGGSEPDDPAVAQSGDEWQLGKHRLLCGDSLEHQVDNLIREWQDGTGQKATLDGKSFDEVQSERCGVSA